MFMTIEAAAPLLSQPIPGRRALNFALPYFSQFRHMQIKFADFFPIALREINSPAGDMAQLLMNLHKERVLRCGG